MIEDEKKWNLGVAKLGAFMQTVRAPYDEDVVAHFHEIVMLLEQASVEDLSHFKIPAEKMKPRVISAQPMSYDGRPGHVRYADKKHCDSSYFLSQVHALANYIPSISGAGAKTNKQNPYESLRDYQLQELLAQRHIAPKRVVDDRGERFVYDRAHAIAQLLKTDQPKGGPTVSNVFNIRDSNVIHSSPGASITQNSGFKGDEFGSLLAELKQISRSPQVSEENRGQMNVDIGTIELQVGSAHPNHPVVKASLESLKTILEHTAGVVVGESALLAIKHYLSIP
jgi:hypothetical protein